VSIFSRLSDIVNSNLNAILANAEDPEKIIRLVIQEMEDTLVEVRSQAVRAIADRRELERRAEGLIREEAEWRRRAELALSRNREDLAKAALQARVNVERERRELERHTATLADSLERQNEDIGKLQSKLADARSRQRALATRHKVADGRLKLKKRLYDERINDAFSRFEQVERALDEAEGRVEAYDLGRAAGRPTLEQELAGLETEAAVEDELAAMKQRLGNRGTLPDTSS